MVTPSEKEREHFARIRVAKEAERDERLREANSVPAMQRIVEGLELGDLALMTDAVEAALDARALGQAELQARARRLGLR